MRLGSGVRKRVRSADFEYDNIRDARAGFGFNPNTTSPAAEKRAQLVLSYIYLILLKRVVMSLPKTTRVELQDYTNNPPPDESVWWGPWNSILTTLFYPLNLVVIPYRRELDQVQPIPAFSVCRFNGPNLRGSPYTPLLVVNIMNHECWDLGHDSLMQSIKHKIRAEFADGAREKVYWIGVIGPHWRYGVQKDDDDEPTPLIPWHDVTHDDASYHDFMQLRELVASI
jgi:hypothetical protein